MIIRDANLPGYELIKEDDNFAFYVVKKEPVPNEQMEQEGEIWND